MKLGSFTKAVLAVSVAICPAVISAETNPSTADEIEVYSAIVQNTLSRDSYWLIQAADQARIERTKDRGVDWANGIIQEEKLAGDEKTAAEDWVAKIYQPHLFTNQLSLPIKWRLVTERDFNSFPKRDPSGWWKVFHEKFPDVAGIISPSRVGLSKDRQTAFVHWTMSFGSEGGKSSYLVLKKQAGRWRVERTLRKIMA